MKKIEDKGEQLGQKAIDKIPKEMKLRIMDVGQANGYILSMSGSKINQKVVRQVIIRNDKDEIIGIKTINEKA